MLRVLAVCMAACVCAGTNPARADDDAFNVAPAAQHSGLSVKWQAAQQHMFVDETRLAACRSEPWMCSDDETRLEAIIAAGRLREGRARIGEINRAINLAIRPASDARRFGVADHWSSPLETIAAGEGDCEDYAILKLLALREAGFARDDLRLLIVQDRTNAHAVAAVRLEGRWLVLDNRTFALVDLKQTHYRLLAQLDQDADRPQYAAIDAVEEPSAGEIM